MTTVRVLEHVVQRVGLAVRLTDLATGAPVTEGITVTAWPAGRPAHAVRTATVTAQGVAGFPLLPGLRRFEDGSTERDDWFASPIVHPPVPFVVRIDDATGAHLPVVREVLVPTAAPVDVALPRSPTAAVPSGHLAVVATVVTDIADPASTAPWSVVSVRIGTHVTGGVADDRGVVVVPVPRTVAPTAAGTAGSGPVWRVEVSVRHRPADHARAPDAAPTDPPTLPSLLTQQAALVDDDGALVGSIQRDLTASGPLVVVSRPAPAPSLLVVRPAP